MIKLIALSMKKKQFSVEMNLFFLIIMKMTSFLDDSGYLTSPLQNDKLL